VPARPSGEVKKVESYEMEIRSEIEQGLIEFDLNFEF
jgi:hypothetical protein